MRAKAIMIQGTASHVGKSVMTAAFCRILRQDGFSVAPFKTQNMSNNSYVTSGGGEIGRAQAVQAEAAGVEPTVHMNPILLKPNSDLGAQVVVWGKPVKTMQAREYQFHTSSLLPQVRQSLDRLMNEFDVVVIEGAGSPAEVNLQEFDIVNMRTAELADAPVILVGDIDRGGVFASFVGTLELIEPKHRRRVKAFLINKFRGDISLLKPGLDFLFQKTGIPVLGVIPYEPGLGLLEEDGLSDERIRRNDELYRESVIARNPMGTTKQSHTQRLLRSARNDGGILIDVIWLPRISNFTDFEPLDQEPDVLLTYLRKVPDRFPDVCIIPGTKSTIADLNFLRQSGFEPWIHECVRRGVTVIGICGGYQMLGKKLLDPSGVESSQKEIEGLGLFPLITTFTPEKVTNQVRATHLESRIELEGYEIHMGRTQLVESLAPVFQVTKSGGGVASIEDGVSIQNGKVWGTYLHGIFDSSQFRDYFLNGLRVSKGLSPRTSLSISRERVYDRLADLVRANINMDLFYQIAGLNRKSVVEQE